MLSADGTVSDALTSAEVDQLTALREQINTRADEFLVVQGTFGDAIGGCDP